MNRKFSSLLGSALIPGFLISVPPGAPHRATPDMQTRAAVDRPSPAAAEAVRVTMTGEDSNFGCKISVSATNKGSLRAAISRDSQVRSYAGSLAGPWKKLDQSVWINPGQTAHWVYDLTFGCNAHRQYRFVVKQFDANTNLTGTVTFYYPDKDQGGIATLAESFSLGDLNRFF